ncbi:EAL domain-containing protein [Aeoliella mucimassa]|uniref:EAL domain-containing protein n=1 Tax=Aeoliella mucimassa TaxID=2527972 RepID=UPI0018D40D18|nr:EAL domain-containing protein [Aeoliella mucimassa]
MELTFVCTSLGRLQRTLTKPLPRKKPSIVLPGTTPELAAVRSMNEALLLQAIPIGWSYFTDPSSGAALMTAARILPPVDESMVQGDAKLPTRVASRLELMGWHLAAEHFASLGQPGNLLLNITHRESLNPHTADALDEVAVSLKPSQGLGIGMSWDWVSSAPDSHRILHSLRELGHTIVFHDFAGGGGCIESMDTAPPDYLVLASQVVRDIADQSRRLQRLEIVNAACVAQGIRVVLPLGISEKDQIACRDLGISVVQSESASSAHAPMLAALSS